MATQLELDVIIPVKDRTTVVACLERLRAQVAQAPDLKLGRILLCDGGSRGADCLEQLAQVGDWAEVELLAFPAERGPGSLHPSDGADWNGDFNKGWLLNQGIATATAPIVLISDVDILWNSGSLTALAIAAASHPDHLYHIQAVEESQPQSPALQRPRYAYRIDALPNRRCVELYAAPPPGPQRPGCGLVCAQRSLFWQLGGYCQDFRGWGWEDQDLLVRAQLLGYSLGSLGWVTHLSHADGQRNGPGGERPQDSRDRNILRCLAGLAQGRLRGDLSPAEPNAQETGRSPSKPLLFKAPPELMALAEAHQERLNLARLFDSPFVNWQSDNS